MGLIELVFVALLIGGLFVLISKQLIKIRSAKNKSVSSEISKMTATDNEITSLQLTVTFLYCREESIVS